MLVLSRWATEGKDGITITDTVTGERIKLKVILVSGSKVRLGIYASDQYEVWRDEIQERIDEQDKGKKI